ncbi:MAG TPA: hypothetical protein VE689_12070 [Candidatus Udaeobacter sp.]|jgi:hypothetical protein|nr:hypothetical protein [Candidatus Udaeobacter sp.]
MKRMLLLLVWAVSLIAVRPAIASSPAITGEISGVELCAQSGCDAAIFTGTCDCVVGKTRAPGFFWVAVQHDPLPAPLAASAIFAGKWNITTLRGRFSGKVLEGSILNNGNNTFNVTVRLRLQKGGTGDILVSGVLDHDDFPPTFEGALIQP